METETVVRTVSLKWTLFNSHERLGQHEQEAIMTFPEELVSENTDTDITLFCCHLPNALQFKEYIGENKSTFHPLAL